MMLYTIVPIETIFEEEDSAGTGVFSPTPIMIRRDGIDLLVEQMPGGEYRIQRLISTNPRDFLNPKWQPGSILSIS